MTASDVEIGQEYEYLDSWIKVLEVWGDTDDALAVVESRFGDRTTVAISELSSKRRKAK